MIRRRSAATAGLLGLLLALAVSAAGVLGALVLLVDTTATAGTRTALAALPAARTSVDVRLSEPQDGAGRGADRVAAAVRGALGGLPAAASSTAESAAYAVELPSGTAKTYFGELDALRGAAVVTTGSAPGAVRAGRIPVLLPEAAARPGLGLGSRVTVSRVSGPVTVEVTGLYRAVGTSGPRWSADLLSGRGAVAAFPDPDDAYGPAGAGFGPLLVAPGALDAAGIGLSSLDVDVRPDLTGVAPGGLATLTARLDRLDADVRARLRHDASAVGVTTQAPETVRRVATTLAVTGAIVAAVGAVLLVPAAAVLIAATALLAAAREGERRMLRLRGASLRRIAVLALPEGALGAAVVLVAGPLLASGGYRWLAAQPAVRAAGLPASAGAGTVLPLAACAAGAVLAAVVVAAVRGAPGAIAARRSPVPAVLRSGADVAVAVLAAAALVRLRLAGPADVVALAAPALLLLAAVLIGLRALPLLAVLASAVAARTRGALLALAAWRVGRRASAGAVLLVALAMGTGAFGVAQLATWRTAQDEQARFALGAGLRSSVGADVDRGERLIAARATPVPVVRAVGQLDAENGAFGTAVQVLGLPAAARRGLAAPAEARRGSTPAPALGGAPVRAEGAALPAGTRTVAAAVTAEGPRGVRVSTALIVESPSGLLRVVDGPTVDVRRAARTVRYPLPTGPSGTDGTWRVVGLRAAFAASEPVDSAAASAGVVLRGVTALGADGRVLGRPDVAAVAWRGAAADAADQVADPATGAGLDLEVELPADADTTPTVGSLVGWTPDSVLPVVLTGAPGRTIATGAELSLVVGGATLPVYRAAAVAHVAGAVDAEDLAAAGTAPGLDSAPPALVLDGTRLARALVVSGSSTTAGEWWADLPDARAVPLAAALRSQGYPGAVSARELADALGGGPLRVVVQPALLLAVVAGCLFVAVGYAAQAAAALRARRSELAQLVALGLPRGRVLGLVAVESVLVCGLGAVLGVAAGLLAQLLAGPALAVAPGGAVPFPPVRAVVPWAAVAALGAEVAAVLGIVLVFTARAQRRTAPAELLRAGHDA